MVTLAAAVAMAERQPAVTAIAPGMAGVGRYGPDAEPAASGLMLAQMFPFERNKVETLDPHQAFLEGYQAYKRHDYIAAVGRMQYAASAVPELADYALFYLGSAQRDNGDISAAADSFRRLTIDYPQSVFAGSAGVEYAQIELRLGHPDYALTAATAVANTTNDGTVEQDARLVMARALLAAGDFTGAYGQAQMIRERFPGGAADAPARELAYQVLSAHPGVSRLPAVDYHRTEATLLLREGQAAAALAEIHHGLAIAPPDSGRAEFIWLMAQAERGNPAAVKSALMQYLEIAPRGAHAAAALDLLAHVYWRANDTGSARIYFGRMVKEFPEDRAAADALFEIGRTYEDDGAPERARPEYLAVIKRYGDSEAASDARFRAPFMLYMMRRYDEAAAEFERAGERSAAGGERDMYAYWAAKALERNGEQAEANRRFALVARSVDSNYYPALAAMKVHEGPPAFPAASAPELSAGEPPVAQGAAAFHLQRVVALRQLGLRDLEAPELRAIGLQPGAGNALRDFVLAEMQAAGSWCDAIRGANRLAERHEIDPNVAERLRYPRGYWELVSDGAQRNGLDPYLLAALIRQESLYDPEARSVSDARGLMQLLPSTAQRYAAVAGVTGSPLDLYDPALSVRLGTTYLRQLFGMFDGDMFKAVAAYNGGEHAVAGWIAKYPGDDDQWVENIGYRETRDYVKKVIGGMREYRLLYATPPAASNSTPPPRSPG